MQMNLVELRKNLEGESLPLVIAPAAIPPISIRYLRKRGCRRYVMRLKGGILQVTLPYRYSIQEVQKFLRQNERWVEEQYAKFQSQPKTVESFGIGSTVLFRGQAVEVLPGAEGSNQFIFAGASLPLGASSREIRQAIYQHLYKIAWDELPVLTARYAEGAGLRIAKVTVRNQKSRWGSCSTRSAISLNWRLVQTPDLVRDYIIYHELMHLRHMNHSAEFWRAVEMVFPAYREAEQWLKEHGGLLRS